MRVIIFLFLFLSMAINCRAGDTLFNHKFVQSEPSATAETQIEKIWRQALDRHEQNSVFKNGFGQYEKSWKNVKDKLLKEKDPKKKMFLVNNFWNRFQYRTDVRNYGKEEYWAAPFEVLEKGHADCEDYVIAKYLTLKELGFNPENMKIVVVKDDKTKDDSYHCILAVDLNNNTYILDNNTRFVFPQKEVKRVYKPLFALNEKAFWKF